MEPKISTKTMRIPAGFSEVTTGTAPFPSMVVIFINAGYVIDDCVPCPKEAL